MPAKRRGELARRHPDRRLEVPEPAELTDSAQVRESGQVPESAHVPFETLVERALDALPEDFAKLLEDVAIVIAEVPTPEQARLAGLPDDGWLYGLYEGVPSTEWGSGWVPFPNKITLFQLPLETDFPDPDELAEEVRITVIHELGHHAGIDDQRLHELGAD